VYYLGDTNLTGTIVDKAVADRHYTLSLFTRRAGPIVFDKLSWRPASIKPRISTVNTLDIFD